MAPGGALKFSLDNNGRFARTGEVKYLTVLYCHVNPCAVRSRWAFLDGFSVTRNGEKRGFRGLEGAPIRRRLRLSCHR